MFTLLQAQPGANSGLSMFLMIGLMFVIVYFFMIRPQRKRQKEIETFRNGLAIGDKVITASGVYGTVKSLNQGEQYLTIEIAKGVEIKVDRNFVYQDASQQQGVQK
jgi:preprotein translocase subunit YajC